VAARGLDTKELAAVISYELPIEADVHVHRVGRTGRAGRNGLALHLFSSRESSRVTAIEQRLGAKVTLEKLPMPSLSPDRPVPATVVTLCVDGGRRDKLRPGDLLGALTGDAGLAKEAVGKINTFDTRTYFAIDKKIAKTVLHQLREGKIKGKKFRVRLIDRDRVWSLPHPYCNAVKPERAFDESCSAIFNRSHLWNCRCKSCARCPLTGASQLMT